jgi:hypothetical protein
VDIETGNETGGDDSDSQNQNENENEQGNENEIENDNQPFITDNDEQPGIIMEPEEDTSQTYAETSGVLEGETAGVLQNNLDG